MENKLLNNMQDIIPLLIPVFLLSQRNSKGFKMDIKLDGNYISRAKMLEEIKPYFAEQDQRILEKAQDIFDILGKFNRIISDDYNGQVFSLGSAMSSVDKRERILSCLAEHLSGNTRNLAEGVVTTKQNIFQTKANIDEFKNNVSTQNVDGLSSMIKLANSIEPLMRDSDKQKLRKVEKIAKILMTPDKDI